MTVTPAGTGDAGSNDQGTAQGAPDGQDQAGAKDGDNGQQGKPADQLGDAGKQAIDRMKTERADAVRRAKVAEAELEKFRKASMSDAENQVAEAETRGRQSATAEFGKRLARSSFDALAAKRNPEVNTDDIVEFVDMSRFLGDDGEVDAAALQSAVDRLIPAPQSGPPSFDGGARKSPGKAPDMNTLIRQQAGRA